MGCFVERLSSLGSRRLARRLRTDWRSDDDDVEVPVHSTPPRRLSACWEATPPEVSGGMTIKYDAGDLHTLKVIFTQWNGTMIKMLAKDPAFWSLNIAHGVCLVADRYSSTYQIPQLDWKAFNMISPLIAFFLIFYTGKAYGRLTSFWEHCIALDDVCMNWAAMVQNNIHADIDTKWNCLRLLLGSMRTPSPPLDALPLTIPHPRFSPTHFCRATPPRNARQVTPSTRADILYYTINDSEGGITLAPEEWDIIQSRQLLTRQEIETIDKYDGCAPSSPRTHTIAHTDAPRE